MNRAINHLSSFFFFLLACLVAAGLPQQTAVVHAATLHVGGTDPSAYSTIQVALDDAVAGDTVLVHAGTYYENVILKSGVSLSGEGADVTKIIGQEVIGALSAVISAQNVTSASINSVWPLLGVSQSVLVRIAGSCASTALRNFTNCLRVTLTKARLIVCSTRPSPAAGARRDSV